MSSETHYFLFLKVIITEDYVDYVDYMKKLPKKTSHEVNVKNYYASKARSATLKNLTDHLSV